MFLLGGAVCCGLRGDRLLTNETIARRRPISCELLSLNLIARDKIRASGKEQIDDERDFIRWMTPGECCNIFVQKLVINNYA